MLNDNEGQYKAYVLHQTESCKVINDKIGNKSIVLLFSLYPHMVRAFSPIVEGHTINFQYNAKANKIMDKQTGSESNFNGLGSQWTATRKTTYQFTI